MLFIRIYLKSETYLKYQSDALAFVMMLKCYDEHLRWSWYETCLVTVAAVFEEDEEIGLLLTK
jgi:hypothetical protein